MKGLLREALGRAIAAARADAGLTQEALGRRADLGQTVVSRIESGTRRMDFLELVSIAEALGVDLAVLLDRATAETAPQGPDYIVIGLRLDDEHPVYADALRPAVRLLERLAYLEERVGGPDPNDRRWSPR